MSTLAAIVLGAYLATGFALGYVTARDCYRGDNDAKPRKSTDFQPGNVWGALLVWFNITWSWGPFLLICALIDAGKAANRRGLGRLLFGGPR